MMPCPIRDHYEEFWQILQQFDPEPVDESARAARLDPEYRYGLASYDRAVAELFDPIWKARYLEDRPDLSQAEVTALVRSAMGGVLLSLSPPVAGADEERVAAHGPFITG